ncbi:bestrophin-like domain [Streptomyces sp. H27-D2]|uniref:bestrophin-like domain n=1 Tax=Streptomyces sp. H27-D2 TaxID=3046304 RepID=UPI002DBB047B|nr:hypothetical protein [Streptomyces sp. H27-D2]MEC4020730.1 hypothetical protein [Streptomyces sp. H27-D2]
MSEWLVLTIAMIAACAVVLTITVLQQRRLGDDDDPSETPDVIEYMTMMIGVVYAIVLGLAIAGVWEARSGAQDEARHEAQALHEVSARSEVWPAATHERIQRDVDAYVRHVVTKEWAVMIDKGGLSDRGTDLLDKVRRDVSDYVPRNDHENQAYQPMVDQVAAADDARNARGENSGPTMPGVVWFGLIIGGLVTVGMIFMLQIRRSARELLLAGLFSALIAFLLFLIWDLDAPFGRDVADSTGAFLSLFPGADSG